MNNHLFYNIVNVFFSYERSMKKEKTRVRQHMATALLDLSFIPPAGDNAACETSNPHIKEEYTEPDEDRVSDNTAAVDVDLNIGILADEFTEPVEDRVTDNTGAIDIDLNIGILADEFTESVEDRVSDNTGAVDVDLNMEILAWHTTNS